jgi:restriction endonuclease S subunit
MTLDKFVGIKSGRTFKNGIPSSDNPTHSVVQLRDFDKDNDQRPIQWEKLNKTSLASSRVVNVLELNDIVMVAKGPNKKAILLNTVPDNVVTTQHFFILKVTESEALLPEFLVHYLNSSHAQRWMKDNGGGSYQSILSKTTLTQLPLPNISFEQQKLIAETAISVKKEIFLHNQLIKSREQEIDLIFNDVWANLK